MNIYFAASITGGRGDQETYFSIIEELKQHGHVLTEHFGSNTISDLGEQVHMTANEIFTRDMDWVREAGVIIAEVTTPSLGVGYELGQAEAMGKPILCLYRKTPGKNLSGMVRGNPKLEIQDYETLEDIQKILVDFFAQHKGL